MTSLRDRYVGVARFEAGTRLPFHQFFGLMPGVREDWLAEGAPAEEIDGQLARLDPLPARIRIATGAYPPYEEKVVEETADYRVVADAHGGKSKLVKGYYATIPVPVEFAVRSADDWRRIRSRYEFQAGRLSEGWAEEARATQAAGQPIALGFDGFFGAPRRLLGDEAALLAYYDAPALVHDICETRCQLILDVAAELEREGVVPDRVGFWEDLAGKQGSMLGPKTFREFMLPYYRRVTDRFHRLGVPYLDVDSDGNVTGLIPLFLEAGVDGLHPFECQAGMDVVQVRREYGRSLIIAGGLDKLALTRGRDAIDRELAYKLPPMVESGGYVAALDHRLTRGVPFADFVCYVDRVERYLDG